MKKLVMKLVKLLRPHAGATLEFRAATLTDLDHVVAAIVAESAKGHFNADYGFPPAAAGLCHQVSCLISDAPVPWPSKRNGAGGRALCIQVNGHDVGFALLLEDTAGSWKKRVESFALVIADSARGHGIGTQAVRQLVESIESKQLYARCYATSPTMRNVRRVSSGLSHLSRCQRLGVAAPQVVFDDAVALGIERDGADVRPVACLA
jgi:predicted acetyltransferase